MARYVVPDATGLLPAFYNDDDHGDDIPAGAVPISDDAWSDFLSHQGLRKWDPATSTFDAYAPPPPPPVVPSTVTNYQARAELIQRGLFAKVDAALRGADQAQVQNQIALAAWDYANVFERASPLIAAMAGVLGLADADVDALFTAAAAVS